VCVWPFPVGCVIDRVCQPVGQVVNLPRALAVVNRPRGTSHTTLPARPGPSRNPRASRCNHVAQALVPACRHECLPRPHSWGRFWRFLQPETFPPVPVHHSSETGGSLCRLAHRDDPAGRIQDSARIGSPAGSPVLHGSGIPRFEILSQAGGSPDLHGHRHFKGVSRPRHVRLPNFLQPDVLGLCWLERGFTD